MRHAMYGYTSRYPGVRPVRTLMLAAMLAAVSVPASAQLPNASTSTLALAGNHTATARGFGAISVNPAGLAMPGSGFSLALAPIRIGAGLAPVGFGEIFFDYGGVRLTDEVKNEWLARVTEAGGETGSSGFGVSPLAMTVGSFGIQVSTVGRTSVTLPPGVAEAILFGNAGRTGSPADLMIDDAAIDAFLASTVGVSYAMRAGSSAIGATVKYTHGHVMALARRSEGAFESEPLRLTLDFPMIATCEEAEESVCTRDLADGGHGVGLDVGWMIDLPAIRLGASVLNVFNTFSWNPDNLGFRAGTALMNFTDGMETEFTETDVDAAPEDLRAAVEDMTFKPRLQLGAALDVTDALTLSADIQRTLVDGGIELAPRTHAGVGAEFRALGFLHLRGGFAAITDGVQYGGGASLVLGPVNLSVAAADQQGTADGMSMLQFGLSFGNR